MNFWDRLQKPIMVLAPMADVTDAAFRRVIAKYGKPDVMWTEFVSADGLVHAPEEGRKKLLLDLLYTEAERPIVAQFFTSDPAAMESAASLALELGFDGVDINMGCPDRSIEKQGAGAAMIKNPKLAREIIRAAKRGATKDDKSIPVSVKTRIGFNKNELETWLPELLAEKPAVITVHARTRKEMSKVPARWEEVKRAVEVRNELAKSDSEIGNVLIFGNGDVTDLTDARKKAEQTGCDGVMLGRAIFGNPWLFANLAHAKHDCQIEHPAEAFGEGGYIPTIKEKLLVMIEHTKLFEDLLGKHKNFAIMKKHYKAYVNGFDGAKELRMQLMEAGDASEVERLILLYTGALPKTA